MHLLPPMIAALLFTLLTATQASASDTLRIGGGTPTGAYQQVAEAICRVVARTDDKIRCAALSTQGSITNLQGLRNRNFDLALAQSDSQYHAYHGIVEFQADGPNKQLRSLFSIIGEPFTLVARKGGGINRFKDLAGARVGIGEVGSGMRATLAVLLARMGWSLDTFGAAVEGNTDQHREMFCRGELDAFIYIGLHPIPTIARTLDECQATILPVVTPSVYTLVSEFPYFTWSSIPAGIYPGQEEKIPTFGVLATLVTTTKLSDEMAYEVAKSVFEHSQDLHNGQPIGTLLMPDMMIKGNTAPLHPGAERYYREAGLLPD